MTPPAADPPSWLDDFIARLAAFEAARRDELRTRAAEPERDTTDHEEPQP